MKRRVLLVDNYDSFTWNLVELFRAFPGCRLEVCRNDRIDPDSMEGYDGILFSPGPGIPAEVPVMQRIIRNYGPATSILGICLGHQAIAEAYGGRLFNMPQVSHGLQCSIHVREPADPLFKGLPVPFRAGLYHSWAVDPLAIPSCLRVTAVSEDGTVMGLSHTELDVRGIQFHPESYLTPDGIRILANWIGERGKMK